MRARLRAAQSFSWLEVKDLQALASKLLPQAGPHNWAREDTPKQEVGKPHITIVVVFVVSCCVFLFLFLKFSVSQLYTKIIIIITYHIRRFVVGSKLFVQPNMLAGCCVPNLTSCFRPPHFVTTKGGANPQRVWVLRGRLRITFWGWMHVERIVSDSYLGPTVFLFLEIAFSSVQPAYLVLDKKTDAPLSSEFLFGRNQLSSDRVARFEPSKDDKKRKG